MSRARTWDWIAPGLLALAVVLVGVAGYAGYALYPRFGLPASAGTGLLVLAAGAGVASFFSPCSFGLLGTLLVRETAGATGQRGSARALRFAAALSLGAATFLLLVGLGIALGASALFEQVTFTSVTGRVIRAVTGGVLVTAGLVHLGLVPGPVVSADRVARPLKRVQARVRREHPTAGFGMLGFAYVLAGFGWTGPILAGLAGHALTVGGFGASFAAFVTAAATMSILFFVLAFVITRSQEDVVGAIRTRLIAIRTAAGALVVVIGLWLLALAAWADFFADVFPV